MTRLDRYILKQVMMPSGIALFLIGFLAVSSKIRERADSLMSEVLRISDVMRLCVYFFPTLLSYIVPIAYFFGILMGLGQMAVHEEIGAINAAGISQKRIMAPIVLMGAVLAFGCLLIQDRLQPLAIREAFDLMKNELPKRATVDMLQPGVVHEYEGWRVYIGSRDAESDTLYDVDIVRPDEESGVWVFHAKSATLRELSGRHILELRNGHFVSPDNLRSAFDSQELMVPARTEIPSTNRLRLGMNLSELFASERQRTHDYEASRSYALGLELLNDRREIADRLSLPFAALAVSFAGAPIALSRRRGSRTQLLASGVGVLMFYYLLRAITEPQSLHDLDDYMLRVWLPNLALIGFGATVIWRRERFRYPSSNT